MSETQKQKQDRQIADLIAFYTKCLATAEQDYETFEALQLNNDAVLESIAIRIKANKKLLKTARLVA